MIEEIKEIVSCEVRTEKQKVSDIAEVLLFNGFLCEEDYDLMTLNERGIV